MKHTHTHIFRVKHTHIQSHTRTQSNTHTHTCTHTHTQSPPPPLTHTKTVSHSHTVTHIQSHPHTVTSLVTHTHPHRYYPVIIIYICQSSYYSFLFVSTFVSCIPVINMSLTPGCIHTNTQKVTLIFFKFVLTLFLIPCPETTILVDWV